MSFQYAFLSICNTLPPSESVCTYLHTGYGQLIKGLWAFSVKCRKQNLVFAARVSLLYTLKAGSDYSSMNLARHLTCVAEETSMMKPGAWGRGQNVNRTATQPESGLIRIKKSSPPINHKLLCESLHTHGLALFYLNGDLAYACPDFVQLCPCADHGAASLNLFQNFRLSAETKEKVKANLFASCIALYAPGCFPHDADQNVSRLEMTIVPLPVLSRIAVLVQPLSAQQEGMMVMEGFDTYKFITDKLDDIIFLQDDNGCILYVNESAFRLLGYTQHELMHQGALEIFHPDDRKEVESSLQDLKYQHTEESIIEVRMRHQDGHYKWVESRARIFQYDSMRVILTVNRDISQRKQTEEQIKFMTFHDSLTGLFNRNYFEQEMNRIAEARYEMVSLIICDVDCLKIINDTLGHEKGDQLIKAAAETLMTSFRISDMVARIGGDEFAVLLPNASHMDLIHAIKRIKKNMNRYNSSHLELPLHLSIGYAMDEDPPFDMQALFKQADESMYRNKMYNKRRHKSDAYGILLSMLNQREPGNEQRRRTLEEKLRKLAHALELSAQETEYLLLFAKVHNVGLLGVPKDITDKDTPLSREELALIRKQAETGYRIARYTKELQPIAEWIYKQHEWWNGQGYPLGLSGENIPLPSRIMAILKAYTAMTMARPYHSPKSHAQALSELKKGAGTQFDPHLVQVFIHCENTQ